MVVGVEPIRVEAREPVDYTLLIEYMRSWPDKPINYLCEVIADDDKQDLAREIWDRCKEDGPDGPDIRKWGKS